MPDLTGNSERISIVVRNNNMEAWMKVNHNNDQPLSLEDLKEAILREKIAYGIKKDSLNEIIQGRDIYQEVMIAAGKEPVNGVDGYFEFFFDRSVATKPIILEDGSVDYYAMTRIVTVTQGDKVIEYHPATNGIDGYNIYGQVLKATKGKDLSPIKGKGFELSEDKRFYTALLTGKIEFQNDRLIISNLLEIKDDLDYLQGDIHFKGDLLIYGNVFQGKVIEADGNITIRGHVEGATIIAGKDIVFESGMQGAQKGFVICGGNVSGKFFEQVSIKAKGDITANAIMNCMIESQGSVIVTGKRGIILGGTTYALKCISASVIGNSKEVNTTLYVGVPDTIQLQIKNIDSKIAQLRERVAQIEAATEMIEEREITGKKNPFMTQKLQLVRTKISTNAEITDLLQEKNTILHNLEISRDAHIEVNKVIYPNTTISISGIYDTITVETTRVMFYRKEYEIVTRNL